MAKKKPTVGGKKMPKGPAPKKGGAMKGGMKSSRGGGGMGGACKGY